MRKIRNAIMETVKKLPRSLVPPPKVAHAVLTNGRASTTGSVTMKRPTYMADIAVPIKLGKQKGAQVTCAHMAT